MNDILIQLGAMVREGGAFLPLVALVGGFLTSLTPCSLSSLPFIIAYIGGGQQASRAENFKLSATYAAGNAITFGLLGLISASLGQALNFTGSWWYVFLGVLMLVVAAEQFGIINISRGFQRMGQKVKRNRFGALGLGIISGIFASPCATPIMIALMVMIATSQLSLPYGALLFLLFALGNAITVMAVGMVSGRVSFMKTEGYSKFSKVIQYGFGALILILGLFLLYQGLS